MVTLECNHSIKGAVTMFKIRLTFCSGNTIELLRVDCSCAEAPTITSVRGKTSGAFRGAGTFQWSSGVRAVACVFLKAKLIEEQSFVEPMLTGESKSLAASLDYALTKQPGWILDMFGVSTNGTSHSKRLFRVTNSHRKRGGPVSISLNLYSCPPHRIEIVLDGKDVQTHDLMSSMLQAITSFREERSSAQQKETTPAAKNEPQPASI